MLLLTSFCSKGRYSPPRPHVYELVFSHLQFSAIKEAARQISELSQEDYITMEYHTSSTLNNDFSLDIYEPIAIQLSTIIDQLRQGGVCTSDSGALSDYEGSLCETEELKSESNSLVALCGGEAGVDEPQPNSQLEMEVDQVDDEGISNGHTVTDMTTPSSIELTYDELTTTTSPQVENSGTTSTNEEKDITTLLSKIKNMSPEELPPYSRAESAMKYDKEACNGEAIMVTDLEKELFSDSSVDGVSSEKDKRGDITAQEESSLQEEVALKETSEESRWHKHGSQGGYSNRHTYRRGRHKTRGFRSYRGRDRCKPKENNPTEVQNGGSETEEIEDSNTEERNERGGNGQVHHHGKRDHNKVYSDPERVQHEMTSHQPSPLVIHSQNMWAGNIHTMKAFNRRERSNRRQHKLSQDFNHYEVGCFLMKGIIILAVFYELTHSCTHFLAGWEQAKDRLIRIASTS